MSSHPPVVATQDYSPTILDEKLRVVGPETDTDTVYSSIYKEWFTKTAEQRRGKRPGAAAPQVWRSGEMQEALTEQQHETAEFRVVGPQGCGKTTWLPSQVEQAVGEGNQVTACSGRRPAAGL